MINIVTSFFNKSKYGSHSKEILEIRNLEYNNCLLNNLKCEYVEKMHLFIEDDNSLNILNNLLDKNPAYKNKVEKIMFNKQPLYSDFFSYSNKKLANKIIMITNSDIYLDKCDNNKIKEYIIEKNNIFCLTRHEHDNTKAFIDKYIGSHDSFIFKSPLNNEIVEKSNFYQNIPGSENLIIYLLHKNNYKLLNPCIQFKIIHLHKSHVRCYKGKRINNTEFMPDYKNVKVLPCNI